MWGKMGLIFHSSYFIKDALIERVTEYLGDDKLTVYSGP